MYDFYVKLSHHRHKRYLVSHSYELTLVGAKVAIQACNNNKALFSNFFSQKFIKFIKFRSSSAAPFRFRLCARSLQREEHRPVKGSYLAASAKVALRLKNVSSSRRFCFWNGLKFSVAESDGRRIGQCACGPRPRTPSAEGGQSQEQGAGHTSGEFDPFSRSPFLRPVRKTVYSCADLCTLTLMIAPRLDPCQ
jgi:hypothetical protein